MRTEKKQKKAGNKIAQTGVSLYDDARWQGWVQPWAVPWRDSKMIL